MSIEVRLISFESSEYKAALALRDKVMRRPLGLVLSEEDFEHDSEQIHIGAFSNGVLCGCLTLAPEDSEAVKMRQVAVDQDVQGQGIGRQLILFAENEAKQRLFNKIILNARETALDFYLKQGYEIAGPPLIEVRIPHRKMQKEILVPLKSRILSVVANFLRIGATAFGGPAAHISLMEAEFVRRKKWLTKPEFLDLLALTNLIPGPNSTEMAIHIGYKKAGWGGLVLGGLAFILPAFLMVWAIAIFYGQFGYLPAVQSVLVGVKPVIIAVIAQAVWSLSKLVFKSRFLVGLFIVSVAGYLAIENEILILVAAAVINFVWNSKFPPKSGLRSLAAGIFGFLILSSTRLWAMAKATFNVPAESLLLVFMKIGSVLFGSGYVLVAFLQSELVEKKHWLTQQQLFDALSVGQFTPGPVFTTATFIGYVIGGNAGALAATLGIFLPAFLFVGLSVLILPFVKKAKWVRHCLDGLNVASLALMAAVGGLLVHQNASSAYALIGALASTVLLVRYQWNSMWLMIAGGFLGWALF